MISMRSHRLSLLPALSVVFFLASCTLGPDYKRPISMADSLESFDQASQQVANAADEGPSMSRWWLRLDDPTIDDYVNQLLTNNLDLRMAAERILQAQEGLNAQSGARYPSVSASGSSSRRFTPGAAIAAQQGAGGSSNAAFPDRIYSDSNTADLNVSWTVDVFGRVRRGIEAADARFQAGVADYEALQHALIAQLVQRRISIAIQNDLLELAESNVANRQQFYELVRRRFDLGTAGISAAEVYLAEETVSSVKRDLSSFERQRADEIFLLDTLLNQAPGASRNDAVAFETLEVPKDVPLGLPFDLLDRRPDVRAAAARFKAGNAEIGIAIADLYPSFSIGGALGLSSPSTRNFVSSQNLTGSIVGSVMAQLFQGGALRANIRLKESQARELALNYEKVVLESLSEVESLLMTERLLTEELNAMTKSVTALKRAEEATFDRYQRGISNVRDYLDTQQRRYAMEQAMLQLEGQRWQNRVALHLALGGDWVEASPKLVDTGLQIEVSNEE